MVREVVYKMEKKHEGQSIAAFLKEKDFSRAVIIQLKKEAKGILKNEKHAGVNEILKAGDLLKICLIETMHAEKLLPQEIKIDILYEDEDLIVVNKPYNMPVHPSINHHENTLANAILYDALQKGEFYPFRCMNRLDRDTTGTVVIAKNLLSASILSKRMQEGGLTKTYVAYVEGVTKEQGTIELPIGRAEGSIIKRRIDKKEGKRALTHYKRLHVFEKEEKKISAIKLKLETGRTHQIRVHMAAIGHPLIGDFLYNPENTMLTRQALHVAACQFKHPITGEHTKIKAPLPQDMKDLFNL